MPWWATSRLTYTLSWWARSVVWLAASGSSVVQRRSLKSNVGEPVKWRPSPAPSVSCAQRTSVRLPSSTVSYGEDRLVQPLEVGTSAQTALVGARRQHLRSPSRTARAGLQVPDEWLPQPAGNRLAADVLGHHLVMPTEGQLAV